MRGTTQHSARLKVQVAPDRSEAALVAPAGLAEHELDLEACVEMLKHAGVAVDDAVREAAAEALAAARDADQEVRRIVAKRRPPKHGTDGRVEWLVQRPEAVRAAQEAQGEEDVGIDHYNRSAFIIIKAGQVVAKVHPPTPGEAGCDITGQAVAARDGVEVTLTVDEESMELRENGEVAAKVDGVLDRHGNSVSVRTALEIAEHVDFSTGNVVFQGDVRIKGSVRDRFLVKATGNVEIDGLIEAAVLEVDGDLHARGGFAGREIGSATVRGNLHAKYLDSMRGNVQGNLLCDREVINCDLTVQGAIDAPRGAIIGGKVCVAGKVQVAALGARSGTETQLRVGGVPKLEPLLEKLTRLVSQLVSREQSAQGTAAVDDVRQSLEKARAGLADLKQRIGALSVVDVLVEKRLHPGSVLLVRAERYEVKQELRGPVKIWRDGDGQIMYRQGEGAATPLAQISDVQ